MKKLDLLCMSLVAGVLLTCAATRANADEWNKKTYLTFSQSIEVPGAVLPPGKYVFKLLDSQSNRHIVQIMNERENHVYATNFAIPKQRMDPADKTIVTFYEMPGGGPEPIRTWFYPGDTIGQEFTYSHKRAQEIALAMRGGGVTVAENRVTTTTETNTATAAPVETPATTVETDTSANRTVEPAVEPTPEPTPTPEAAAAMPETPAPVEPTPEPEPAMPHTAGNLAAIGLLGLGCLGLATTLRIANRAGSKS